MSQFNGRQKYRPFYYPIFEWLTFGKKSLTWGQKLVSKRGFTMSNNNILAGIYAGLNNTYAQLAAQNPDGLTLEELNEARANSYKNGTYLNQSFASYLQTNFGNIDKNGDGTITSDEINNLTNMMSKQGLTRDELTQLYASGASGLSEDTMNKILEHFDEMDTNHDGRVTSAEISAYDINA